MRGLAQYRMSTILLVITFLFVAAFAVRAEVPVEVMKYNPVDNAELMFEPGGDFTCRVNSSSAGFAASVADFWIYRDLVSVAQYRYFCAMTDRDMPEEPFWGWIENHPMVNVSWNDANAYAKWAGGALPTGAQWQLAGYSTDNRELPWGSRWGDIRYYPYRHDTTLPVGSVPAAPYGARDIVGNVWQWCSDWSGDKYYANGPAMKNPAGPPTGTQRVICGGIWCKNDNNTTYFFNFGSSDGYKMVSSEAPTTANCTIGFRCVYLGKPVDTPAAQLPSPPPQMIKTIIKDSCNLKIFKRGDHAVTAQIDSDCNNWFAGSFINLMTDKPVTITIPAVTRNEKTPVKMSNWRGLMPVMTYADPNKYESYENFTKDDTGKWVSDDIWKKGDARYAGTGKLPQQKVMPEALAEQFLSRDGKRWEPWREVDKAEVNAEGTAFVVTQQFAATQATVAMRVPYTYLYDAEFNKRMDAAKMPGVFKYSRLNYDGGQTVGNTERKIFGISDDGYYLLRRTSGMVALLAQSPLTYARDVIPDKRKKIIVYARENATDHDSSWAAHGLLCWLLSDDAEAVKARDQYDWFISPIMNDDDAANSRCSVVTGPPALITEKGMIFDWLKKYDYSIDMVINLHSAECAEAPNLAIPSTWEMGTTPFEKKATHAYDKLLFAQAKNNGFQAAEVIEISTLGSVNVRADWNNRLGSPLAFPLEVNSRYPERRLSQQQLFELGGLIGSTSQVFLNSPAAEKPPIPVKYNPADNAELVYVPDGTITRSSMIAAPSGPRTVRSSDVYNKKYGKFSAAIDGFWIYQKPVTVAQYRYFCQITHRDMPEEPFWKWQEDHPIVNVTWDDAADYAKWAGAALPTVVQWQLAGYGTDGRRYPWGDKQRIGKPIILSSPKPVGSTLINASPYGVLDIVGSVDQWCADWYGGESYYSIAPAKNPTGPATGTLRELRGRSWATTEIGLSKMRLDPLVSEPTIGFRCIYPGVPVDEPTKELPKPDGKTRINLVRTDGFNLKITKRDEYAVTAQLDSVDCNDWWAGNFNSLPTDKPVTITIPTTIRNEKKPVIMKNWQGLVPVMTYADPNKYESYECYSKDDMGRWVSDDLFKKGDERYAGNGILPMQNVIPEKLAAQFLSKDGKRWEPWREVNKAEVSADNSTFVVTQQFDAANASVAMRVPYTYTYEEELLKRLSAAKIPGLTIDTICESNVDKLIAPQTYWKRKFSIIRIESPAVNAEDTKKRPGILVYAREHATEQDSSWALHGMLRWLLSDDVKAVEARTQNNWLLFPIYDADAAANSSWRDGLDCISDTTVWSNNTYAKMWYFANWITKGNRLDLAINLHGSECAEAENLTAPYIISNYESQTDARLKTEIAYNTALFKQAADAGYQVGKPEARQTLHEPVRMVYWTNVLSRTLGQSLEVNSRYPQNRLTQTQMYDLGRQIATGSIAFINSTAFENNKQETTDYLIPRPLAMRKYEDSMQHGQPMPYSLLNYGY